MKSPAPNHQGSYPLAGERIGPAWRELWSRLEKGEYVCGGCLAAEVAPKFNIKPTTAFRLLWAAGEVGLLIGERRNSECAPRHTRAVLHYRVISEVPNRVTAVSHA